MHMTSFHQAEHLARHAAHLQRLAIEGPSEGIECLHDVTDGAIAMQFSMKRSSFFRLFPDTGICLLNHLLAEVDADQVVLKDVVVEHVLGSLAEIDNPFSDGRRFYSKRHVLRIGGASGMVVAADAADAAGNEVRIARILTLHENAVAAKDRRSTVTLSNLPLAEIDFCEDSEAAHDPGNRIPIHFY